MMTSIAVGLGYWLAGSVAFAVVWSFARRLEREEERERLAEEFVLACRQRYERDLAAAGLREVTQAQINAAFGISEEYDAALSRDEAERMQRLLAFGMVAPVMARRFEHPAPVQVQA